MALALSASGRETLSNIYSIIAKLCFIMLHTMKASKRCSLLARSNHFSTKNIKRDLDFRVRRKSGGMTLALSASRRETLSNIL